MDALTVLWDEFRAVNRPAEEFFAAKGFRGGKLKRILRRMTEAAQEIPRPELEPPTRVIPESEFGTEARPGRRSLPPAEPIPGQPPPPSPPWPGLGKTPPTDVPPPGLPPASGFEMPETSLAGPLLAGAGEPGAVPAVTRGGLTVPGGALDVRRGIENLTTGAKIGIGQVLAEKF
ncbi:MAG TPA: hypothetical protein DCP69_09730, partial [Candidatus Omnitrophica bacterium]|nr:hypothetical protein [Candidatus Omnitrophota bacterium]